MTGNMRISMRTTQMYVQTYYHMGYSMLPVWQKVPHPYLIARTVGTVKVVGWVRRKDPPEPVYSGSFQIPYYARRPTDDELGKLFPTERFSVLWKFPNGSIRRLAYYGVAIATGPYLPPLTIIDIDTKGVPNEGRRVLVDSIVRDLLEVGIESMVITPHDGIHIYTMVDDPPHVLLNQSGRGRAFMYGPVRVDVRRKGGYVLAPPSKCFCERCAAPGGTAYRWVTHRIPPPADMKTHELASILILVATYAREIAGVGGQ